ERHQPVPIDASRFARGSEDEDCAVQVCGQDLCGLGVECDGQYRHRALRRNERDRIAEQRLVPAALETIDVPESEPVQTLRSERHQSGRQSGWVQVQARIGWEKWKGRALLGM